MFGFFKYIDYALKARQGYNAPDELLADTSFGFIEGFFVISFIALGVLSGGSLFVGFHYGYLFFKIFGFILLVILVFDIILFRFLKKITEKLSKQITDTVKNRINTSSTIDVEGREL